MLICTALTAYFAFHAVSGRHGLSARSRLVERSHALEREIKGLEAVRLKLKRDVVLLAPDVPHPDMVEEIARTTLGYVQPGDKVLVSVRR